MTYVVTPVEALRIVFYIIVGFLVGLLSYACIGGIASLIVTIILLDVNVDKPEYLIPFRSFLLGYMFAVALGGIAQHYDWIHDETKERLDELEEKLERYKKEVGRIEMDLARVLRELKDIKNELESR